MEFGDNYTKEDTSENKIERSTSRVVFDEDDNDENNEDSMKKINFGPTLNENYFDTYTGIPGNRTTGSSCGDEESVMIKLGPSNDQEEDIGR